MASSSTSPADPDRLHGWKEISAFVGKGLRTVQRWEKQHGLPVRRLGDGSDIVFASKREIEAWLELVSRRTGDPRLTPELPTAPGADEERDELSGGSGGGTGSPRTAPHSNEAHDLPADGPAWRDDARGTEDVVADGEHTGRNNSPRGRSWTLGIAATVLLVVVGVGVRWLSSGPAREAPRGSGGTAQVASWEIDGRYLRVFDRGGRELWTWDCKEDLAVAAYPREYGNKVVINDIDGDGNTEVLLVVHRAATYPNNTELVVMNVDGSRRFEYSATHTARFGDDTFVPPWVVNSAHVTMDAAGKKSVWVVSWHAPNFPSVVERLDPANGTVLSSYWNDGYISGIWPVTWRGRPALAVSATNNDFRAGSLAIFEGSDVRGAAPANRPAYRCGTCPDGTPSEFFVFPRSCLWASEGGHPSVQFATTDSAGTLKISVGQGWAKAGAGLDPGSLVYWITPDSRLTRVDPTQQFEATHDRARRTGLVDHEFGTADEPFLFPVLRWDGTSFVPLNKVRLAPSGAAAGGK